MRSMPVRNEPDRNGAPAPIRDPVPDFDRVARGYQLLERLAFGRTLHRARTAHLAALGNCRRILVIGEGDGRLLADLVNVAPAATILCVDSSAAMLQLARDRLPAAALPRVSFRQADARTLTPGHDEWDAVITLFVLDCLTDGDVRELVPRLAAGLTGGGHWLWADFAVPPGGWRRWQARIWLGVLYPFFRWTTGLQARHLPPAEQTIESAGLRPVATTTFQAGLVRSVRFVRPASA